MQGKFIVFEGLDGSGKTSVIEKLVEGVGASRICEYVYSKGLGSRSLIGRIASRFPSTPLLLSDLLYSTKHSIRPALDSGRDILQDRYFISIKAYLPDAEQALNKLLIQKTKKYLLEPDILFYMNVAEEERIRRLKEGKYNKHHERLLSDMDLMRAIESRYKRFYDEFRGEKYVIDTTGMEAHCVAQEIRSLLLGS
jgi:dTMP kinase